MVTTANGSEVPLNAPATFLSLRAWRDSSSLTMMMMMLKNFFYDETGEAFRVSFKKQRFRTGIFVPRMNAGSRNYASTYTHTRLSNGDKSWMEYGIKC